MADLKPCPFCGGEVKGYLDNHKKAMIECEKCNMYFGIKLEIGCELVEGWKATFDSKEELFEAWNIRKPMEAVVAKLEKESFWSESTFDVDGYCNDDSEEVVLLSDAVKIVRNGGKE